VPPRILPLGGLRRGAAIEFDLPGEHPRIARKLEGRHAEVGFQIEAAEVQRDDVPGCDVENRRSRIPAER
jgi:hypothetical protein